ncbi:MAG: Triose-phosphate Transporter [Alyxoria varia]|nr:MAG: Triose-phosphate Transporter [Alyxoria varia]
MGIPTGEGKHPLPDRSSTQKENNPPLDPVSEFRFPHPAPHDDKKPNDHDSRRSSASMSSDLELNHMDHSERRQHDEENGFADGSAKSHSRLDGTLKGKDDEEYDDDLQSWVNQQFVTKVVVNGILIGLWYLFSVSISVYNKWMFADGQLDFHFPLFTTSMHMIVQFILASLILVFFPSVRPGHDYTDSANSSPVRDENSGSSLMTPNFYITRIAPCATATGLDIGLGNTSLRFVTLIFFTMCKSSTLGFVLGFAVVFRLEKASWKLAGIIGIMTVGVIMMVAGETAFSAVGFILLMMASFFSGLRWSLTQMLLRRNPATSNPFASLFFLTPVMFLTLFVLAIPVEGFGPLKVGFEELIQKKGPLLSSLILMFPGILAFLMTSAEFALLKRTSVVTLSVCGIFKEVITIGAGGIIFDETLTPINVSGVLVTILAIAAYNYIRMRRMKRNALKEAQEEATEEQAPMLSTGDASGPRKHETRPRRMTTGDMIRRSLSISTLGSSRPYGREGNPRSTLVKLPENVQ